MSSQNTHDIITAVDALFATIAKLPAADSATAAVQNAAEDLRGKLGRAGYNVGTPAWMGTGGLARSRSAGEQEQ